MICLVGGITVRPVVIGNNQCLWTNQFQEFNRVTVEVRDNIIFDVSDLWINLLPVLSAKANICLQCFWSVSQQIVSLEDIIVILLIFLNKSAILVFEFQRMWRKTPWLHPALEKSHIHFSAKPIIDSTII